jgi:purine-binding chemotaxis protein CheW
MPMTESLSNAYLTFLLNDEKFAVHINSVQEIVELNQFTKVPNTPDYMLGIINLRGKVLPLLDTRLKLGLQPSERNSRNRVLILDIKDGEERTTQIGAIVDVAKEVVTIEPDKIQKPTDHDVYKRSTPVTGIVNYQGDITLIIDINKVFASEDVNVLVNSESVM